MPNPNVLQPSPDENTHQAKEEAYWERQLTLAEQQNWIAALAAVAGIFGIGLVLLTLKQTRKQAQAAQEATAMARESLEANDRPWLAIDSVNVELDIFAGSVSVSADITAMNYGPSPAHHVRADIRLLAGGQRGSTRMEMEEFIAELIKEPQDSPQITAFPKSPVVFKKMDSIPEQSIKNARQVQTRKANEFFAYMLKEVSKKEHTTVARAELAAKYQMFLLLVVIRYQRLTRSDIKLSCESFILSRADDPNTKEKGFNVAENAHFAQPSIKINPSQTGIITT